MQVTLLERMDRDTRILAILAVATLVFVVAAVFALASSSKGVEPAFEPEPFFPELAQQLGTVQEVVIRNQDETLRIAKSSEGQWVLPDKDKYPVRLEPLREILLGLGELTKEQPATANQEWHKELNLGAPEDGGEATQVTLKGEGGKDIVTLLVGQQADLPDISGLDSWYVRAPGDQQSWLARGTLSLRLDPAAWIVTDVVPVDEPQIRSATITPPEGPAYTVARAEEKAQSFTLMNLPEGAAMRGPRAADGVGLAIADLKIKDARLASDFSFENAPVARYRTFNGLEITVRTLELGEDIWGTIEARFDGQPGGDAAQSFDASSMAADINQRVAGWAFLLPTYAGRQMRLPVSELVKPTAPPPAPEAGEPAEEAPATEPVEPDAASTPQTPDGGESEPPAESSETPAAPAESPPAETAPAADESENETADEKSDGEG